jgi:hypothetical protein
MGVVYLASDPMLNRQVAVKTVDLGVNQPEERDYPGAIESSKRYRSVRNPPRLATAGGRPTSTWNSLMPP